METILLSTFILIATTPLWVSKMVDIIAIYMKYQSPLLKVDRDKIFVSILEAEFLLVLAELISIGMLSYL